MDCQQYFIKNGINNVELFFKLGIVLIMVGWLKIINFMKELMMVNLIVIKIERF